MKNFKKILSMVLAAVLLVVLSVGATVAYLTAEADPVENTFTVGDISIGLTEEVKTEGAAVVVERPADPANNVLGGATYTNIMPGDKLIKIPTVTNTGANPAYVALTVTVNNLAKIREVVKDQEMLDKIFSGWDLVYGDVYTVDTAADATLLKVDEANETAAAEDNWFEYNPAADTAVFTYYLYLENQGDSFTPFEEINVPAAFSREQLAMFEGLNIKVEAAAIQADNVPNAKYAFAALENGGEELPAVIANDEELAEAIKNGETVLWLDDGTFHMPSYAKGKTLTINGSENTVIEVVPAGAGEAGGQLDYNLDGSTVTFNDLTIKTNSQLYAGFVRLSGTYHNCVIQNTYNLGVGSSAFYNCVFNITNEYLRVGGANSAVFDGCTFNTIGRAILVYQDGTNVAQTVTVKDCTFNASAAAYTWNGIHVAAVSIDGTNGSYTVNLEGTNTVDSNFNGLWQIKTGETNVTVNE